MWQPLLDPSHPHSIEHDLKERLISIHWEEVMRILLKLRLKRKIDLGFLGFFFFSAKIMAFWSNQNLPIIWHLYTGNPGIKSLNAIWKYWFLKCNVHYILTSLLATLIHHKDTYTQLWQKAVSKTVYLVWLEYCSFKKKNVLECSNATIQTLYQDLKVLWVLAPARFSGHTSAPLTCLLGSLASLLVLVGA